MMESPGSNANAEQQPYDTGSIRSPEWSASTASSTRKSGPRLIAALHRQKERLFHDAVPETCPTDDRKHGHLAALALAHLITHPGDNHDTGDNSNPRHHPPPRPAPSPGPEFIVVIDLQTLCDGPHAHTRINITGGVEMPIETLRRHACLADIIPAIVDTNGVIINLGRTQRLANNAQRRALRAMYSTCAIPGCNITFDHCQPHHLWYWTDGGPTDLDNLIPLCSKHHHLAHEGGWQLALSPHDRALSITLPDGSTHPPPQPPPPDHHRPVAARGRSG